MDLLTRVKRVLRRAHNALLSGESMVESKEKWNRLASQNAAYYVMTDYGEGITEEQFANSGQANYKELIEGDQTLQSHLAPFGTKDVLEIGCGIGRITEFLAENFQQVSGIDISEEMIEQAKKRLGAKKNVLFHATDGLHYPYPDASFNFIFSFIVFQHMPDVETVKTNIREISRVLKEKGVAKIQLRGLPTSKKNWFYGPSFSTRHINDLIRGTQLKLLKSEGENQRYFWIWLSK